MSKHRISLGITLCAAALMGACTGQVEAPEPQAESAELFGWFGGWHSSNPCDNPARVIEGTEGDDVIYGTWHADCIYGHGGNDVIFAGGGEFELYRRGWRRELAEIPWPTRNLPEIMGGKTTALRALIREYLFVSLFRACAESLASENASRLAAMQRADKNIDELLEHLNSTFHRVRQSGIDEELFDVVSGFEALAGP